MVGRNDEHLGALERAHQGHIDAGAPLRAASCAFWIGMRLFMNGEVSRGGGWLARAQRLVEDDGSDCVERGYLLMPETYRAEAGGDIDEPLLRPRRRRQTSPAGSGTPTCSHWPRTRRGCS